MIYKCLFKLNVQNGNVVAILCFLDSKMLKFSLRLRSVEFNMGCNYVKKSGRNFYPEIHLYSHFTLTNLV